MAFPLGAGAVFSLNLSRREAAADMAVAVLVTSRRQHGKEYRAVFATIGVLETGALPGIAGHETEFSPGRAYVRRVSGHNLWILYRFDDDSVFIMTARSQPPVPTEE